MKFKADEITSVIQREIEQFQAQVTRTEVGRVLEVGDGIARIHGLSGVMTGEMVAFSNGVKGMALNLEESSVGVIILGDYTTIHEGETVTATGQLLRVPVGEAMVGRVVNPLGVPIDNKGEIQTEFSRLVESTAPGIAERQPVDEPMQTGIKAIDAMTPIGRGQRELIIGDRKTGKTAIAIDAIMNQKGNGVICVYVAVAQKESTTAALVDVLRRHGAMDYTIVVAAGASDPAPLQFIAPYAGCAMAEYFMYEKGGATLVIYDDLSKQAVAYHDLKEMPGHKLAKTTTSGGSLTALPLIETLEGEVSAYIPTNVISITDGQIYLQPDLFFAGVRPAIDVGISVSRVGGNAQAQAMKKVAGSLRLDLSAFRDLEAFAQLGTELDKATQSQLDRGQRMVELLKQPQYKPVDVVDQIMVIYAGG